MGVEKMTEAMENEYVGVRGTKEMMNQAELGLKLFEADVVVECDTNAAEAFKKREDAKINALQDQADSLTGKDNKKARSEKGKEVANIKHSEKYVDAERVVKGLSPSHGNFVLNGGQQAPASAKKAQAAPLQDATPNKDDKKSKRIESAGISKAERDELEQIKNEIIARKGELKATGMSGGQINKDEQVAKWVARMNALKEKENPGSTDSKKEDKKASKKLSKEQEAEIGALENEVNEYRDKLQAEFKYTKKEIAADPDMMELTAKLNKAKGIKK